MTLKFYYNGIKDNGGSLQKCHYSKGYSDSPDDITIYGKHYKAFSAGVHAAFTVESDSDYQSDYCQNDSIRVTTTHPLYAQVLAAWQTGQDRHNKARVIKTETPNAGKLEAFRALVESDQKAGLIRDGMTPENHNHACAVKTGLKYANVDVGHSGRYMVELSTGEIYGIKGYGVIHRGHHYGNLDTINQYDWSGYKAYRKQAA